MNPHRPASRLLYLCDTLPAQFKAIPEADFAARPAPGKWSKKEILGHLIDSATNNHQRFVRGQFEQSPIISYDQNQWVQLQDYQTMDTHQLIQFWELYNRRLAHIMQIMPDENRQRTCRGSDGKTYTLEFLMADYVVHLEHHLKQMGIAVAQQTESVSAAVVI